MKPVSAPAVRLPLPHSRCLRLAVLVLAGAAMVAIHLSRLPEACLLLVPPLAGFALFQLARQTGASLLLRGDGSVAWITADEIEHAVTAIELHERGLFGVLACRVAGRMRYWAFAGDSLPWATRRELRLWMRDHAPIRDGADARIPSSGHTTSPG